MWLVSGDREVESRRGERERRRSEEGVMGRDPGGRQQHLHTHRATVCVCVRGGECVSAGERGRDFHCTVV